VNYFGNKEKADQVVENCQKHGVRAAAIQAVAGTSLQLPTVADSQLQDLEVALDIVRLVKETVQSLGGLDVIVNNVGWTKFSDFDDLTALTLDEWNKVGGIGHILPHTRPS
jgi:NAD(P)-dependent dehydrogenase (short-subunit alcohol dehydrogenase family)